MFMLPVVLSHSSGPQNRKHVLPVVYQQDSAYGKIVWDYMPTGMFDALYIHLSQKKIADLTNIGINLQDYFWPKKKEYLLTFK